MMEPRRQYIFGRNRTIFSRFSSILQEYALAIKVGAHTAISEGVVMEDDVRIGANSFVGANTVIRHKARIGDNVIIGHLCSIEEKTLIHSYSTIQNCCYITMGVVIEPEVFIGPGVVTTNDAPMVKYHPERGPFVCNPPLFRKGCSVGAGSVILPGVVIGRNAVVGAGSVVSKNVPEGEKWYGCSARLRK